MLTNFAQGNRYWTVKNDIMDSEDPSSQILDENQNLKNDELEKPISGLN